MKTWMQERDLLIAQTMAFVEEVAAATAIRADPSSVAVMPTSIELHIVAPPIELQAPVELQNAEQPLEIEPIAASMARLIPRSAVDERAEIMKRVASFKAHQARFLEDRDKFFRAAMTRIGDPAGNQSKGKPM
jgi:hypothetical protein